MPSVQAFVALSTSVWLLEHASGFRTETPLPTLDDAGNATKAYARCDYAGPEGGPLFRIGLHLPGTKPEHGTCKFRCKAFLHEFNTAIMPKVFDSEFVSSDRTAGRGAFCRCKAHGGSRTIIRFNDNSKDNCKQSDCWRKYLVALNFKVEESLQVGRSSTMQSKCKLCDNMEECADEVSLVHVDDMAKMMRQPQLAVAESVAGSAEPVLDMQMITDFAKAMRAEGIILDDGSGSAAVGTGSIESGGHGEDSPAAGSARAEAFVSGARSAMPTSPVMPAVVPLPALAGKDFCNPSTGPFPRQCIVEPGPRGDEWIQQLSQQRCTGNQFVVQFEDRAVAITVPAVTNLVGEDVVDAAPTGVLADMGVDQGDEIKFTPNFRVLKQNGVVRIAMSEPMPYFDAPAQTMWGDSETDPTLDYVVTGLQGSIWFPYSQGLVLNTDGKDVTVVQHKPEQITPNHMMSLWLLPISSYTHKPTPPNSIRMSPLSSWTLSREGSSESDEDQVKYCDPVVMSLGDFLMGQESYDQPTVL